MLPQDNYDRSYVSPDRDRSLSFPSLMRSVYIWMALALAVTGLTAMTIATQPQIVYAIFANRAIFWMLLLAELGMVIYLSARIMSMSFATPCSTASRFRAFSWPTPPSRLPKLSLSPPAPLALWPSSVFW